MASCCVAQLSLGEAGLAWSSALIASAVCKGGRGEVCYVSDDTNVSIASICSWELLVSSVSRSTKARGCARCFLPLSLVGSCPWGQAGTPQPAGSWAGSSADLEAIS